MMRHLGGMAALAARYDGFIVDLWGALHDGVAAYPGAVDCLHRLRDAGRRVVLLSNAPRPVTAVLDTLRRLGIPDDAHDGLLTSGEATRTALARRSDPWFAALGERVWHLGPAKDLGLFEGLPQVRVATAAEADFVLNTGPDDEAGEDDATPYLPVLRDCAARGLPMVCANPDLEIVRGGQRVICAGLLARHYAGYGGVVRQIGKPDPAIYRPVRRILAVPDDRRILAIGDSLLTDIAGARAAGLDSCWVLGGIHAGRLRGDVGLAEAEALAAGLAPVATVPGFTW